MTSHSAKTSYAPDFVLKSRRDSPAALPIAFLQALEGAMTAIALDDQHAFVRLSTDDALPWPTSWAARSPTLTWRSASGGIPVVEDAYTVAGAVRTFF